MSSTPSPRLRPRGTVIEPPAVGEPLPPDAQLVVSVHYADSRGFRVSADEVHRSRLDDPMLGPRLRNLSRLFGLTETSNSHLRRGHGGGA